MSQILKDNIRHLIVEAAIDDLYEHGYKGASMRRIASVANMTVGNLYRYFKNKDDLINYIIEPVLNKISDVLMLHTNQSLDFNNHEFSISSLSKEDILSAFNQLSSELASLHHKYPKVLVILMNHSSVNNQFLNWFTDIIKPLIKQNNKEILDLLARAYSVSMFAGIKECLIDHDLTEDQLNQTLQLYFKSYMNMLEE